ncbi:MAG: hypothetical protein HQL13_05465, partial [Candidatus Omnitrophica bacterium]|nr:hypothetical protein [Candidatus Omnitrophota bacterium]
MLTLHHVGCLVESIDKAILLYAPFITETTRHEKIFVASQKVYVVLLPMGKEVLLELIEPAGAIG